METESEDEGFQGVRFVSQFPPYLKLYEEEEYRERRREDLDRRSNEGDGVRGHFWKLYRVLRFFHSLTGFHRGYLDLGGRHLSRYHKLILRWSEYIKDY